MLTTLWSSEAHRRYQSIGGSNPSGPTSCRREQHRERRRRAEERFEPGSGSTAIYNFSISTHKLNIYRFKINVGPRISDFCEFVSENNQWCATLKRLGGHSNNDADEVATDGGTVYREMSEEVTSE
ncbi:hypothetical protein GCM10009060_08150 [Halorubrum trapanicum]